MSYDGAPSGPPSPLGGGGGGGGVRPQPLPPTPSPKGRGGEGRVARYARGPDYHLVLRDRPKQLGARLPAQPPGRPRRARPGAGGRAVAHGARFGARASARRAGLGWFGKNTMLIHPRRGSYFVLGGLLCDVELAPTGAFEASHCGTCTRCLGACPTGAFV